MADIALREIESRDDPLIEGIIRDALAEFDATGPGTSFQDPELMAMSDAFGEGRSRYFVAELRGQVVGGAGVAPLAQGDEGTCELKKMYLASAARGQGVGAVLLDRCLVAARELGYAQCYLETMEEMVAARLLYERRGFRPIATSMGSTGHDLCNRWYVMSLEEQG